MKKHLGLPSVILVGVSIALSGCAGGQAVSSQQESDGDGTAPVDLVFAVADKTMSPATASYATVPIDAGYFAEEGLSVEMQPVDSVLAALQAVASGGAECTYVSTGTAVGAIAQDPALVILGTTNGTIYRTIARADLGIESMADLEDRTIGISAAGITTEFAKIGMADEGVTASGEQFLEVGFGAQAAQAFASGMVDAYSGFDATNLVIQGLLDDIDLVEVEATTDELTGTLALVCRTEDVADRPEVITGLLRAFFKGMVFAEENPDAAVEMHWERYPAAKPEGDEKAAHALAVSQLERRLELTGGVGSGGMYGLQDDQDLENTLAVLNGIVIKDVPDDKLALTSFTDYSLVDEYNDFDPDAVRAQARDWGK